MAYKPDIPTNNELIPLEKWHTIPYYIIPGMQYDYWVSTYGNVAIMKAGSLIPQNQYQKDNDYLFTYILTKDGRKQYYVHRLVMLVFAYIPGCESLDVNHKDTIKTHNWLWNLEWNTRSENIRHAIRNGLMGLGESATGSKLTNQSVFEACRLMEYGVPLKDISKYTGIEYNTVYEIYRGNTWLVISKDFTFLWSQYPKYFTQEQINEIIRISLLNRSFTAEQILEVINYDYSNFSEPKRRIIINLTNKIRYDVGLDIVL